MELDDGLWWSGFGSLAVSLAFLYLGIRGVLDSVSAGKGFTIPIGMLLWVAISTGFAVFRLLVEDEFHSTPIEYPLIAQFLALAVYVVCTVITYRNRAVPTRQRQMLPQR